MSEDIEARKAIQELAKHLGYEIIFTPDGIVLDSSFWKEKLLELRKADHEK